LKDDYVMHLGPVEARGWWGKERGKKEELAGLIYLSVTCDVTSNKQHTTDKATRPLEVF